MWSPMSESASPIRDLIQSSRVYDAYTHPHQSPPPPRHRRPHLEYTVDPASSYHHRAQGEVANLPIPYVDSRPHSPEILQTRRHLPG